MSVERAAAQPGVDGCHLVQFYREDELLCRAVAQFVGEGLAASEPSIVVATASHAEAVRVLLHRRGFEVDRITAAGQLTVFDANEVLQQITVDGEPDRDRFRTLLLKSVTQVRDHTGATRVRLFGEIVDLLCRAGNSDAALAIEQMANELACAQRLAILCGYAVSSFRAVAEFDGVCAAHGRSFSIDRHVEVGDAGSSVPDTGRLADRAFVLEAEIAHRSHLERRLRDENHINKTLHRLACALHAELDLTRLVQTLTEEGASLCHAEYGAFYMLDATDRPTLVYAHSAAPSAFFEPAILRATDIWQSASTRCKVVRHDDLTMNAEAGDDARLPGRSDVSPTTRSLLGVRVLSRTGNALGALLLGHSQSGVFSARDEELIVGVAAQAGIAIDNARLYEAERRARASAEQAAQRTDRLQAITAGLSHAVDIEETAHVVIDMISPVIAAEASALLLLSTDRRRVERLIIKGDADDRVRNAPPPPLEFDAPAFEAARTGRLVWICGGELLDQRYPAHSELRRRTGALTWGGIPLSFEGRTVGALGVRCNTERVLSAEDEQFLLAVGQQCAQALERARLLGALRETVRRLQNIQAVTSALSRARTPADVAAGTVHHGVQAVAAEACAMWLRDDDGSLRLIDSAGLPTAELPDWARLPPDTQLPAFRVLTSGEPEFIETEQDYARMAPQIVSRQRERNRLRAFAAMPLTIGQERRGVLVFSYPLGYRFAEDEKAFLLTLARQCEQALERAQLYASEGEARRQAEIAQTQAEQASRTKDEFLAMLGHELRNPLAPIVTALQLMKLRGDIVSGKEQAIIERQVEHLVRLVDDLLDISRITRGKVELDKRLIELHPVVARAVEIASPLLEHRRHNVAIDVPREGIWIDGDETRLAQVIANLLTNAAKYTEPGGHITLRAWRDGHEIVLQVKDNGMGIAPDLLPHVFDLFVQGHRSVDRSQGGLGIGLALVRNLVALHGGSVVALSEGPGKGSEFVLRLPGERTTKVDEVTNAPAPNLPLERGAARRVLVVDDNEDAAELLAEMLKSAGHDVVAAYDGVGALAAVETFVPDVAVLDIGLPVMDGYELAAKLQERLGTKPPRLIALTGYGQEHDRERSRAAGFDLHCVKPLSPEILLKVIADVPS